MIPLELMAYRMASLIWTSVFFIVFMVISPFPAGAEIYQFTSPDGVIHFTNVPTDPRFHRMTADPSRGEIDRSIQYAAQRYDMDPDLIKAVIKVESDFDPKAVSRAGALGLMQLMPTTASTLNVQDPFNPDENIAGGVRHLRYLLYEFRGNLTLALAAYHAGETRVKRYGAVPPIEQTRLYIKKVLSAYASYQGRSILFP